MYEKLTTTTTTPMSELDRLRYRFNGFRYQMQGGGNSAVTGIVIKKKGAYTYPKNDTDSPE